jgi:hypothetical protein
MKGSTGWDRWIEFINAQVQPLHDSRSTKSTKGRRFVTISRQAGSGAHVIADQLVTRLQSHDSSGATPWTVFDRNLVEKVLEEHDLPDRLATFMPEDRVSEMADTVDELFGLRPSSWTLVRKTADTILHLAGLGNVVLIGRGGNIITRRLEGGVHVRLVGSIEKRIEHVQACRHLDRKAASQYVHDQDLGRKRYVEKYYAAEIDDPLLYHLIINTDRVSCEEAARVIALAVLLPSDDLDAGRSDFGIRAPGTSLIRARSGS